MVFGKAGGGRGKETETLLKNRSGTSIENLKYRAKKILDSDF